MRRLRFFIVFPPFRIEGMRVKLLDCFFFPFFFVLIDWKFLGNSLRISRVILNLFLIVLIFILVKIELIVVLIPFDFDEV